MICIAGIIYTTCILFFRTPPYRRQDITEDVKVCIELKRMTDGTTSDSKTFTYKPSELS